jgi:hypothetical protein
MAAKGKPSVATPERFIVDEKGKRVGVVLDIEHYKKLLEELATGARSTAEGHAS